MAVYFYICTTSGPISVHLFMFGRPGKCLVHCGQKTSGSEVWSDRSATIWPYAGLYTGLRSMYSGSGSVRCVWCT